MPGFKPPAYGAQPTHRDRAREAFARYFGDRCFRAEDSAYVPHKKAGEPEKRVPYDVQVKIPDMVLLVRAAPDTPGRRFIEWFSGIGDSLIVTGLTVLGSFAGAGYLAHLLEDSAAKFDPRHPSAWFIIGGLVGAKVGLKLLDCVHVTLKSWVHRMEDRETASVACDVLLSGYVTDGSVQEKLLAMIKEYQ